MQIMLYIYRVIKKPGPVHDITAIAQNELEVPNLGFVHLNMCSLQLQVEFFICSFLVAISDRD